MSYRLCNICYEYNDTNGKSIYNCPNPQCFSYSCKSCLIKWFSENNKCPICHVNVNLLEIKKLDDPIVIEEEIIENTITIVQRYNIRCNNACRLLLMYFISLPLIILCVLGIIDRL